MQFLEIKRQLTEAKNVCYSYSYCLHLIDFFVEELAVASDKDSKFILLFYYAMLMYRCNINFRNVYEKHPGLASDFKFIRSAVSEPNTKTPKLRGIFFSVTTTIYKDVSLQAFYLAHSKNMYIVYDQKLFKFDLRYYGLDERYFNRFVSWYMDRKCNEITSNEGVIDI